MKFGAFEFDGDAGRLSRNGSTVAVGHRGGQLLRLLLERAGEVVGKDDLMNAAWPGQAVEESNLTVQIAALRKALGTAPEGQEWIATVPRVGYRFLRSAAASPPQEPAKPSIAVLPFENMSNDPEQEFFASGLSEDLITDLSKVQGLIVIARNSSFAMRERRSDIRGIGAELGVRFIVDGSVRRAGDKVRINAQLIEAGEQAQLWAGRFDGDTADVFLLQDQVVARIVGALSRVLSIGTAPATRRPVNLEAYELFVRGRALVLQSNEGLRAGQPLLVGATRLDPDFAEAYAWLAMSHVHAWFNFGESPEINKPASVEAAKRAVEIDGSAMARAFLGYVRAYDGDTAAALTEIEEALRLDPSLADALIFKAEVEVQLGRPEDAIATARRAFQLNPFPPHYFYWILGFAQYAGGLDEAVVETLDRDITRGTGSRRLLAAAYAQVGQTSKAKAVAAEFLAAVPNFSIERWSLGQPFHREGDRARFIEGYRKAGLPG
ncbi:MAG: winged helix-turn-helix domain-containing protein [Devosia sp.]